MALHVSAYNVQDLHFGQYLLLILIIHLAIVELFQRKLLHS